MAASVLPAESRGCCGWSTARLAVYSELTLRARAVWRQIEDATGADLYRERGVLFLFSEGDDGSSERASRAALDGLGVAGRELEPQAIVR